MSDSVRRIRGGRLLTVAIASLAFVLCYLFLWSSWSTERTELEPVVAPAPRVDDSASTAARVLAVDDPAPGEARTSVSLPVDAPGSGRTRLQVLGSAGRRIAFAATPLAPPGVTGRSIDGSLALEHALEPTARKYDYAVFAEGYVFKRIQKDEVLNRPVHVIALESAPAIRFIMDGVDPVEFGVRSVVVSLQPDTGEFPEDTAHMLRAAHRTKKVESLVLDVDRLGVYGGKAIFSVLDSSGRPIGPGPEAEFAATDREVVVDWRPWAACFRSVSLDMQLRFHSGAPIGDLVIELRPSAADVQMRRSLQRSSREGQRIVRWDAVPPGRYEVTLSGRGVLTASLGFITVSDCASTETLDVYGSAQVSVRVLGVEPGQTSAVRLEDLRGRVVAARTLKDGVFESTFTDVSSGTYCLWAASAQQCSPPRRLVLDAGADVAVDLQLRPCGTLVFAAQSERFFEAMLRHAGFGSVPVVTTSGASRLLPGGDWVLECMAKTYEVRIEPGVRTTVQVDKTK